MAIAAVRTNASVSAKGVSITSLAVSLTTLPTVGNRMILIETNDNARISGITDPAGNTWTNDTKGAASSDPGQTVGAFALVWSCQVNNAYTAGASITLTFDATVTRHVEQIAEFSGLDTSSTPVRGRLDGTDAGTTSTIALTNNTFTGAGGTGTPVSGDLVLGVGGLNGPTSDTYTSDSDTLNGSWSTITTAIFVRSGTTGGSATANQTLVSQFKIVTAGGNQTWNGTLGTVRTKGHGLVVYKPGVPIIPPAREIQVLGQSINRSAYF